VVWDPSKEVVKTLRLNPLFLKNLQKKSLEDNLNSNLMMRKRMEIIKKPRKVMTIKKVVKTIKKVVKTKKKVVKTIKKVVKTIKKVVNPKKEKNTKKKASIKKVAKKEKNTRKKASIKKVQKKIMMEVNQRKVVMVVAQKVELLVLVAEEALVVQHQSVKAVTIMVQVVTLMHRQKVLQKKNNGSKQRKPQETTSLETLKLSMLMVKLCL